MNYSETLNYLYTRMPLFQVVGSSAYKPGLESMKVLDSNLGHPHHSFRTIHVAGTNGKGSVSHTLAAVLQSAGYRVGLFTSPHLKDFRERVRVDGEMMPQEYVIDFVERHKTLFEVLYPSFFEVCVGMAFDYFRRQNVDVAVIEVGLGGRLDSTNIITPSLSVITNISYDHMNILGETLPKIAAEKAGIIKPGVPVVIGEAEDLEIRKVFVEKAAEEQAPIMFVDEKLEVGGYSQTSAGGVEMQQMTINGQKVRTELLGDCQKKNLPTAYLAVRTLRDLGYSISREQMEEGFEHTVRLTHLMGRWQQIGAAPLTICDTGHNEGGIRVVTRQLANTPHKTLRFVYGVMADKDVSHILPLLPKDAVYYFTQAGTPRAMKAEELRCKAQAGGLNGGAYDTVAKALAAARSDAEEGDLVFVGGSTYVVAEVI